MYITSLSKFNIFNNISGLRAASVRIAGKECFLDREEGLTYLDFERAVRRDGVCGFAPLGRQLLDTGKFPIFSRIKFPDDPAKVRDFIRLVVRTETTLFEASLRTGVSAVDLTKFHPRPVLAIVK